MEQGVLQFNKRNFNIRSIAFYGLVSGTVLSVMFYMYCINGAVRYAVDMNSSLSKISSLQGNLSDLESKYMTKVNSITMDSAKSMGFVDPEVKTFISKNTVKEGKSLSYNN